MKSISLILTILLVCSCGGRTDRPVLMSDLKTVVISRKVEFRDFPFRNDQVSHAFTMKLVLIGDSIQSLEYCPDSSNTRILACESYTVATTGAGLYRSPRRNLAAGIDTVHYEWFGANDYRAQGNQFRVALWRRVNPPIDGQMWIFLTDRQGILVYYSIDWGTATVLSRTDSLEAGVLRDLNDQILESARQLIIKNSKAD